MCSLQVVKLIETKNERKFRLELETEKRRCFFRYQLIEAIHEFTFYFCCQKNYFRFRSTNDATMNWKDWNLIGANLSVWKLLRWAHQIRDSSVETIVLGYDVNK
jgi:hypothetical protein